jgi:Tol biopolymer transport system component
LVEHQLPKLRVVGSSPIVRFFLAAALAGCGSSTEQPAGRFVYSGDLATPNASRLFVVGADGSGAHKVTRGLARVGEGDADWSPDGSRIVFDRTYDCAASLGSCFALWVVNADGSAEERLTPEDAQGVTSALSPTWSPDGRSIAYVLLNDRSEASDIWVMNADGSGKRRLTHVGDAEGPAWAPDGRKMAFSHDGDIFVLDREAGSLQRLTKTPALESYPNWSPDGKRIAYELNDSSPPGQAFQEYDAYVMDADGKEARRLSRHGDLDGHPVWSPGGKLIAYGSDALPVIGDGIAIVIVDAGSGRRVRRIPAPGMDLYPIDWTAE